MANDVLHTGRILTVNGILEVISDDAGGGGGDPTPPTGFAFVVNGNGDYFVTQDGDYVVQEIA